MDKTKLKSEAEEAKAQAAAAEEAKAQAAAASGASVKVRVLVRCGLGAANDVVSLTAAEAEQAAASGEVDPHPDAVAYAEGLQAAAKKE